MIPGLVDLNVRGRGFDVVFHHDRAESCKPPLPRHALLHPDLVPLKVQSVGLALVDDMEGAEMTKVAYCCGRALLWEISEKHVQVTKKKDKDGS